MKPCPSGNCECFLYFLIRLDPRVRKQAIEADGTDNRCFFCEKFPKEEVTFRKLFTYYITNGGASGFAEREKNLDQSPALI